MFHRLAMNTNQSCTSSFGHSPNCYPEEAGLPKVIDNDYCAADFSKMYNVSEEDTEVIKNLTGISMYLHSECESIHTQVRMPQPSSGVSSA
jgi:uncharacterized protein YfcZ (UPF0381/DUF406 family)